MISPKESSKDNDKHRSITRHVTVQSTSAGDHFEVVEINDSPKESDRLKEEVRIS